MRGRPQDRGVALVARRRSGPGPPTASGAAGGCGCPGADDVMSKVVARPGAGGPTTPRVPPGATREASRRSPRRTRGGGRPPRTARRRTRPAPVGGHQRQPGGPRRAPGPPPAPGSTRRTRGRCRRPRPQRRSARAHVSTPSPQPASSRAPAGIGQGVEQDGVQVDVVIPPLLDRCVGIGVPRPPDRRANRGRPVPSGWTASASRALSRRRLDQGRLGGGRADLEAVGVLDEGGGGARRVRVATVERRPAVGPAGADDSGQASAEPTSKAMWFSPGRSRE